MNCSSCQGDLGDFKKRVAFICVEGLGDEYIYSYFYCDTCACWTVEMYIDRFLNEEQIRICGPIAKVEGDRQVELIRQCPDPSNKRCDCQTHRTWQE